MLEIERVFACENVINIAYTTGKSNGSDNDSMPEE